MEEVERQLASLAGLVQTALKGTAGCSQLKIIDNNVFGNNPAATLHSLSTDGKYLKFSHHLHTLVHRNHAFSARSSRYEHFCARPRTRLCRRPACRQNS